MFRYIKEHKEYTYDLAKNYIYASEFVHALTVLEYIDEIYPFKSLNENDKLDRLSLWTFYFNSKGEIEKVYDIYNTLISFNVSKKVAYNYLSFMHELLGFLKKAEDVKIYQNLLENAWKLSSEYLDKDSSLYNLILNDYLSEHCLERTNEDTSDLAREVYLRMISKYPDDMIEVRFIASLNYLYRLFDNHKYNEIIVISKIIEEIHCKYPSKCIYEYYKTRHVMSRALVNSEKYKEAITELEKTYESVYLIDDEIILFNVYAEIGFLYAEIADKINNEDYRKIANKQIIKALKIGKEIWGEEDYILIKLYVRLADIKYKLLHNTYASIELINKAITINDRKWGKNNPDRESLMYLLSLYIKKNVLPGPIKTR